MTAINKISYPLKASRLLLLMLIIIHSSCITPIHHFSWYPSPPIPDYSNPNSWAALPDKLDSADAIPPNSNEQDGQANAAVDVFYIHPTMDFSGRAWNGDIQNENLNKSVDKYPIRFQASVFNASCKVYAPRYRQATLYSFTKKAKLNGDKALALAYDDVRLAFRYYLDHYNNGRPFIIASHSQGSRHAYLLLNEFIENNPQLRKQLIAVYAIGFRTDTLYESIPRCDSASQTGCLISWNTYKWGKETDNKYLGSNYYCVNPLSWKSDSVYCSNELNLGGLPRKFDRIDERVSDAKIQEGLLWIHKPKKRGYWKVGGNYHVSDYNLFYSNIRKNVQTRIDAYFAAGLKNKE